MPFEGQPVNTTTYRSNRAKVGDGKSVRVSVPESTTVEAGKFYVLDGYFGAAMQSVTTDTGETSEVILNIEQAEFETDQITTSQDFTSGTMIYWNESTSKFTETVGSAPENRKVGRVTESKDANNVIHFILGPQV